MTALYNVVFKRSAEKELRNVPKAELRRMISKIQSLTANPRPTGCIKLSGQMQYRLRQGDWRMIYEVADDKYLVTVVKIGHRREVYSSI